MQEDTEYAKEQEEKHRRKIILPCVIPWEYGSNQYASQKGLGGFGKLRNTTLKIESSKELSDGNNGVVPFHSCPTLHERGATQAGERPFGSFRGHVTIVKDHDEKKEIHEILVDPKATERVLKLWSKSNPEAKNDELYGRRRNAISESFGGRRFTQDELNKSRASIPKFQNFKETSAGRDLKVGDSLVTGYQPRRQVTTVINGLDRNEQDQLDSNKYTAWLGGQLTLQSQSQTGGFQKPRDVVNTSYYARLLNEKDLTPEELYQMRKSRKSQVIDENENDEN
ncbi:hypothetical protein FO519_008565 [Halicephalobus sp. NKZ332]|nr:hypothetical protein FO519_008565 [Halicephalobus sp. NKZ332]